MPFIFTGEILKWGQFSNLLIALRSMVKSDFTQNTPWMQ